MAKPHCALPDGFDCKLQDVAKAISLLDPRMSPEEFLFERDGAATRLYRMSEFGKPPR